MIKNKKHLYLLVIVFVCILIGIMFLVVRNNTQKVELKDWITYIDPKDRFSVLLPRKPNVDTKNDKYTASNGSASYIIYITKSGDMDKEVQKILAANDKSAKLIYSDHYNDSQGIAYLDYKIQTKDQILKGRMFLIKGNVVVLLDEIAKKASDTDEFNHFIASFGLI